MNVLYESADMGGRTSGTRAASNGLTRQNATTPVRKRNTASSTGINTGVSGVDLEPVDLGDDDGYEAPFFDMEAYMAQLRAEQLARAQAAYDRNMQRIGEAYGAASDSLLGNYNTTVDRLNAARDKSMGEVNSDAENSLRQAYINNMMTRKNLNQRLSALGYNGGATESTMSSLENNYGKSRSGINETLNTNIANLDSSYGDNLANALESYNSAKANLDLQKMQLEMQAENALNNAESSALNATMSIDGSYMSALQAALANQGNYTYDNSRATNDYIAGNARQAESVNNGNNYAMWMAQQLLSGNNNRANVANYMIAQGIPAQTVQDILAQLGGR